MITTYTGRIVDPLNPDPRFLDIRDIAHALALCNRFACHSSQPISVAQHSVWVASLVSDTEAPLIQLQGLLHDASEAYLGDVTKFLKASSEMEPYRRAEARVQGIIMDAFGVPWVPVLNEAGQLIEAELDPVVDLADSVIVRYEALHAFGGKFEYSHEVPHPTKMEISRMTGWRHWGWQSAEKIFLKTFAELWSQLGR